jgi:hypothetical protein
MTANNAAVPTPTAINPNPIFRMVFAIAISLHLLPWQAATFFIPE